MLKRTSIAALAAMIALPAMAADVDWKIYGWVNDSQEPDWCFYDSKSTTRSPLGNVRVWVKCLKQKDLGAEKPDEATIDRAARRIVEGYVPPVIVIQKLDFEQIAGITLHEELADLGVIAPDMGGYIELNCPERMSRFLELSGHLDGQLQSVHHPTDWRHVPPEGNDATLLKLLCPPGLKP